MITSRTSKEPLAARSSARRSAAGPRTRTALAATLLAALTTVLAFTVRYDGYHTDPAGLSWWYAASWLLFAAAAWTLRKVPVRRAVVLILVGSAAVAATGLLAPPRTSTDAYRYAWDGRVQAAGISPYDHTPADPALVPLRDDWLFPAGAGCEGPDRARVPASDGQTHCTRLNRPSVPTIYPPFSEAYFYGVEQLSPPGSRLKGFQIAGAALSVAVTAALLRLLARTRSGRGDPRTAVYWAWCPAISVEAVNNAHVDVLGVLFTVLGLGLVAFRHRRAGGALLGAAVASKLMPAIVLPGALSGVRRVRDAAAVLVPAAAVTFLAYLPYVLASHSSVLGYLGGYVEEEGYGDAAARSRYALLRLLLPDAWAVPALVLGMLLVSGYVLWRGDPARPWSGALTVTGTAFLLLTPGYSWYALLLVALVALDGRGEWLTVAAAGAAAYVTGRVFGSSATVSTTAYACAAVAVTAGWAWRRRSSRSHPGATAPPLLPGRSTAATDSLPTVRG